MRPILTNSLYWSYTLSLLAIALCSSAVYRNHSKSSPFQSLPNLLSHWFLILCFDTFMIKIMSLIMCILTYLFVYHISLMLHQIGLMFLSYLFFHFSILSPLLHNVCYLKIVFWILWGNYLYFTFLQCFGPKARYCLVQILLFHVLLIKPCYKYTTMWYTCFPL